MKNLKVMSKKGFDTVVSGAKKVGGAVVAGAVVVGASVQNAAAAVLDAATVAKIDGHVTSVTSDMGTLGGYGFDLMFIIGGVVLVLGLGHRLLFKK